MGVACSLFDHYSAFANSCPLQTDKLHFSISRAPMSNSLQASFNRVSKDWPDRYNVWGTPTRSHYVKLEIIQTRVFFTQKRNTYTCVSKRTVKETTSWNSSGKVIVISKDVKPSARSSKTRLLPNF